MQRCLDLAMNGMLTAQPNPLVGSVVVYQGQIIGEGWHYQSGLPHAEVNAINSIQNQDLLKQSTVYVNLEPCAHHGKTPPCANLIIEKGIPQVVVGSIDPNAEVAGKGIARMREAGVEVITGVLGEDSRELNRKFITYHEKKRPFITLKWAQSADGFMDINRTKGAQGSYPISGQESKVWVHKLRAEHAAILVGPNTVVNDDPKLDVREFKGKNPIRLILDRTSRIPLDRKVFNDGGPTIRYVAEHATAEQEKTVLIETSDFLKGVLDDSFKRGIQSILVEGGAGILHEFIANGMWDEAMILIAPNEIKNGLDAPTFDVEPVSHEQIGKDQIKKFRNYGVSDH